MSTSEFSYLKGVTFVFNDDSNEIKAWFSSFTGLEKIYVNDALVLSRRSLSIKSKSTFQIGNNLYSVVFHVENLIQGSVVCTLSKNGVAHQCKKFSCTHKQPIWLKLCIFLSAFVLATAAVYFKFTSEYFYILVAIYTVLVLYVINKVRKIVIEDVSV